MHELGRYNSFFLFSMRNWHFQDSLFLCFFYFAVTNSLSLALKTNKIKTKQKTQNLCLQIWFDWTVHIGALGSLKMCFSGCISSCGLGDLLFCDIVEPLWRQRLTVHQLKMALPDLFLFFSLIFGDWNAYLAFLIPFTFTPLPYTSLCSSFDGMNCL